METPSVQMVEVADGELYDACQEIEESQPLQEFEIPDSEFYDICREIEESLDEVANYAERITPISEACPFYFTDFIENGQVVIGSLDGHFDGGYLAMVPPNSPIETLPPSPSDTASTPCQSPCGTEATSPLGLSPVAPQLDATDAPQPVFKTPMTFSPRMQGDRARPSPSRFELWKEELGLSDDGETSDVSQSDDETERGEAGQNDGEVCTAVQFEALQRQLEERDAQRDDLLYKVKNLTDKNKTYRQRLEKEEEVKRQQLKIMRRTHESHLQEKQMTIKNLQDVIDELENGANGVEEHQGNGTSSNKKLSNLLEQIERLQAEKAELTCRVMASEEELDSLRSKHGGDLDSAKGHASKLEEENSSLQKRVLMLQNSKNSSSTDTEKHATQLEIDNARLKQELQGLKQQSENDRVTITQNAKHLETLSQENDSMKTQLQSTENESLLNKQDQHKLVESLREEIKSLTNENQASARQVRELSASLSALQARSPEVVTKVKKVEIEDTETKELLEHTMEEKTALQTQLAELQKHAADMETQLSDAQATVEKLQHATTENETLKQELSEIRRQSCQAGQELSESREKIGVLEQQVQHYAEEMESTEQEFQSEMETLRVRHQEELTSLRKETEDQVVHLRHSLASVQASLSVIGPEMKMLKKEYVQLKHQCASLPSLLQTSLQDAKKQVCNAIADIHTYNQELIRKYRKEMQLRKKYHNELVDLKGNIRVFCRARPVIEEDNHGGSKEIVVACDREDDGVINVAYKSRKQTFELDRVFDASISQEEVFGEVKDLVTSCVDGFNVCIFAYGQTGSGKTHTMEGPPSNPGINQRALRQLFLETGDRSTEWNYTISVSVLEIYNEAVIDLLSSSGDKLDVKMAPDGGLHVPGLKSIQVQSVEHVNQVFSCGRDNRATASTNMNEHSSRSHAVLRVSVSGINITTGARSVGNLNLVDLAGSERVSKSGADGARLKEAQNINKSLSCLGDVIHALRSKQSHIPYRNSKLTYLLQDSLGGDSKTLMIVQISPVEKNVGETLASLNFAQRVRSVELGQASKRLENSENERIPLEDQVNHGNIPSGPATKTPGRLASATPSKFTRRK